MGPPWSREMSFVRPMFRVFIDLCFHGVLDFDFALVSSFGDFGGSTWSRELGFLWATSFWRRKSAPFLAAMTKIN